MLGQAVPQHGGAEQGVLCFCPLGLYRGTSRAALGVFVLCLHAQGAQGGPWVCLRALSGLGLCPLGLHRVAGGAAPQIPEGVQGPLPGVRLKGCPVPDTAGLRGLGAVRAGWHRDQADEGL